MLGIRYFDKRQPPHLDCGIQYTRQHLANISAADRPWDFLVVKRRFVPQLDILMRIRYTLMYENDYST